MKKFLVSCLLVVSLQALSQNRISDHNQIGWFATTVTPSITKKVSLHLEYQWRREDYITKWQQSLFRAGVNYKLNTQVTFQAGYAWTKTYAYGEHTIASLPNTFPEHRIYEQVVLTAPVGKMSLQNRLRLEQRWVGKFTDVNSSKPGEFVYLNRLRYQPRLDVPIIKKWYMALYDEVLIGFGKNVGENVLDQNRIAVVAGYKFNSLFRAEAGFINQTVQLGREIDNKNVYQYNNGFVISTYFNITK